MSESRWGLAGQAQGRANQIRQTQNEDARKRSALDSLPSGQKALANYGRERYGQDASREFDKWAATKEGQARIRLAEENIRAGRAGGTQTGGRSSVRDRAIANQRSVFEETYIKERIRQDAQSGQRGKSNSPRNSAGSKRPVNEKPTLPQVAKEEAPPQLEDADLNSRTTTFGKGITQVFDINSFRSEIVENDVLPSHSYLVSFSQFRLGVGKEVKPLNDFIITKRNTLMMRCENVVLPSPSLLEEENIRRYGYGPVEKVPYGVQFSDVTITWLVDKNSEIIDFMHQWMNTIVMHDSPNTLMNYGTPTRPGLDAYAPFEVGYKDAYANPIVRIYVYNRQQQTVTEYELYDVFPMNIQSMNLSWADENQLQKLTVTFAYTSMKVNAPLKSTEQFNYHFEGRTSPYEEREQPENKGGKVAADRKETTLGDYVKKQMNASKPYATDGQYDYYVVELPPTEPQPQTPTPIVHNLTSG